jgi:hypothetical protein
MPSGIAHTVQDGESAESIAASQHIPLTRVWNASENKDLKSLRHDDPHILNPGDTLFVPPVVLKHLPGDTNRRHVFISPAPKSKLMLQIRRFGKPRANLSYVLEIKDADGKKTLQNHTDSNGNIEADISPCAESATLSLGTGEEKISYQLFLRGVHPLSETTGWQARLVNLGYPVGKVDGQPLRRSQASLCAFQDDQKLKPASGLDKDSGKPPQATQDSLKKAHGC